MAVRVAMCMDKATYQNPEVIGLDGENLAAQAWLDVFSTGQEARDVISSDTSIEQAWVISCDDIEPINLAATLKADRPTLFVKLVEFNGCGSLFSRAHNAHIDEVANKAAFLQSYAEAKAQLEKSACGQHASQSSAPEVVSAEAAPSQDCAHEAVLATETPSQDYVRETIRAIDAPSRDYMREASSAVDAPSQNRPRETTPAQDALAHANLQTPVRNAARASAVPTIIEVAPPVAQTPSPTAKTPPVVEAQPLVVEAPPLVVTSKPTLSQTQPGPQTLHQSVPVVLPTPAAGKAFIMPVVSGSGGAGKSTVSVLSALIASKMGYRTLLLDYDLQFGDAALMMGVEGALALDDLLSHPEKLHPIIQNSEPLNVIAAPKRLELAELVVQEMPQILEALSASFDVIVANTGGAWAEQHAVLLEKSSAALFLIDQRSSSVHACRHALELCERCGIASGPFRYVLNRCAKGSPLSTSDVSHALQGASVFELKDGGREVEDCLSSGIPLELIEGGNELVSSLHFVLDKVLPDSMRKTDAQNLSFRDKRAQKRRARQAGRKRRWMN